MRWFSADLHIHTVLSPCAGLSNGPRDIVKKALSLGLDMIAITDHNSAENVQAVMKAAHTKKLTVIPGIEVNSREDAHFICLFPTLNDVLEFQNYVYDHLPKGKNDPDFFGDQIMADEQDHIIGHNSRLLSLPLDVKIHDIADQVVSHSGIIYPAHIDRKAFSLLSGLGFIPKDLPFHAIEICQPFQEACKRARFLKNTEYSIVTGSDAHEIEQVGSKQTFLKMQEPTFEELAKAIMNIDDRETSLE